MTLTEKATEAAANQWNTAPSSLRADDVSFHYTWLHTHHIFHVFRQDRSSMYVVASEDGPALLFQRMQKESNLEALNTLLNAENVQLPAGIPLTDLTHTLRTLLWKPFGVLGSSALLTQQHQQGYNGWLLPSLKGDAALFESYCQDPHLDRHDGTWTLTFYYFSTEGGVEQWKVQGTADHIQEATMTPVAEADTFWYPYVL